MNINIPGIDVEKAIKNSGTESLFIELLGDVYTLMDDKIQRVESCLAQQDIQNYTIEVHSLKTTCRMIGAADLGEDFFTLEKLGKENNLEQIEKDTPKVLNSFKALKPYLEPFASNNAGTTIDYNKTDFSSTLKKLISAVDDFDLGAAEDSVKQLLSYNCNEALSRKLNSLDKLVTNLDYEDAKELATQILDSL